MPDEPENLTLKMLRRMDAKLDRLIDDLQDVKVRLTSLEENYGATTASSATSPRLRSAWTWSKLEP